ncbi:MAG: LacI family DNA-binding transcriptional regulator [Candidatus Omnitrophica bacterium]|nr:LacI family DNA-binding transcriptional regulator [Candidatus Omnitrophota bacterium]
MAAKRISIKDVARHAKVSITTVSRVINKLPTVNPRNIKKVEEAVAALKYRPNISAQRLASGDNNMIGLVMPGYPGIFHSFFAIEIIRGVGHACESLKLDMVFHITDGRNPLTANYLGGIIFADIIENRKQVQDAMDENVPCLVINNVVQDMDVNYIAINNVKGGRLSAEYLVNLGHRRIATITGNLRTQAGFDRFDGFMKRMDEMKVEVPKEYVFRGDYSRRSARQAAEFFFSMDEGRRPTAIFAQSDDMALEVIAVAYEMGIRIPEDVSVMGFDDNPQAIYGPIALTTVRQPVFEMAEKSVRLLHDMINGRREGRIKIELEPELVVRDSCIPCKA